MFRNLSLTIVVLCVVFIATTPTAHATVYPIGFPVISSDVSHLTLNSPCHAGDCSWQGAYAYWEDVVRPGFDVSLGVGWAYKDNQLTRFAIDRHDMKITLAFVDGHSEGVKLSDLWTKNWHNNWITTHDVEFP